jgi:hypothetical protein
MAASQYVMPICWIAAEKSGPRTMNCRVPSLYRRFSYDRRRRHCGHGIAVLSEASERFMVIAGVVSGTDEVIGSTQKDGVGTGH